MKPMKPASLRFPDLGLGLGIWIKTSEFSPWESFYRWWDFMQGKIQYKAIPFFLMLKKASEIYSQAGWRLQKSWALAAGAQSSTFFPAHFIPKVE